MTISVSLPRLGAVGRARASVAAVQTLAAIRREGRTVATDVERQVLRGWSGWGPLAPAFAPRDDTWVGIGESLREALPADDVELGMQGTYNAFYTPEPTARAMWDILRAVGFTEGRVLEPGVGGGIFLTTAPDGTIMTGVERDTTAADICRLLHPGTNVINAEFQTARLPGAYAAAIGNVPFGDVAVFDANAPREVRRSLHDYFIWRTVDLLAPGGVAVLLTSRHTMDKSNVWARDAIASRADLVAAYRLPNGALGGGTDIVADILVLRRKSDIPGKGLAWREVSRNRFGHDESLNEYWDAHPDAVLGEMTRGGTTQYGLTIEVKPRPGDPPAVEMLRAATDALGVTALQRDLMWVAPVDVAAPPDTTGMVSEQGWHNDSIRLINNDVFRVEGGQLTAIDRPSRELRDLLRLRDLAVRLVAAEADHSLGDRLIDPIRAEAAGAYAAYVRTYGALNRCTIVAGEPDEETGLPTYRRRTPPMGGFRKDPDAPLVFALEVYDDETQQASAAPILRTRQNLPIVRPTRTDDPRQALAFSLNYRAGVVDLDYIAGLLRVDVEQVPGLLGDAVYQDPGDRRWVIAGEYLSGNVRTKLRIAQQAAAVLPQFARNVEALTAVVPPWLGPGEITVNLGAPFIDTDDVVAFIRATLGQRATVRRIPETAQWEVEASSTAREQPEACADWGTYDKDAYQLIESALNGKAPIVYRTVRIRGEEKRRKDPDASLLASEKKSRLEQRFSEFIWEDPDRTDRIVHRFNTTYNSHVARQFSGEHITVDGLAPWFNPYKHQLEYVARAIATPAALCGHPVGAGKTATMAMTAMKLRQLGLIRRPMVVVPNHLREQIDRELRQLFPAARIMSAASRTIAANRRAFNARCATQDWDIVIVTHNAFNLMAVSPQTEADYVREQVIELEDAVRAAAPEGRLQGAMVKRLAKRKDALRERLAELRHRARGYDLGLTFESMGVDYLLVDEAHYYKNLAVPVRTDGFTIRPSKRASGLEMKLRWLAQRGSGRHASLFTGTPVSNTMLELYIVMRYLMQDQLRTMGLGSADAFCQTFVQFVTSVDVTIDGGQFQLVTRPSLFINAPELRMLLSQCADIRTAEQLGLPRPASTVETVVIAPTRVQRDYSARLVARAEHVKSRGRFSSDPDDTDNMLAICGDGRRMATDPALVGLRDPEHGKLHAVAANILRIWREDPTSLQIAFCDVGTPHDRKGTQTYGRLRRLLTDGGMPVGLIRFVHDAKSDADKATLFSDCRADGKVAVIMGSTDTLGVGTNIQRRVLAMHHIDAPWRPADVEQRDGRGLRPGNRYALVRIFRYVVERTFDAYNWQLLTRKIGFISQVVSGKVDRTIEDVSADVVDAYAAVKAAATGQPLLLEKAKVDSEVKRLRGLQRGHRTTVDRLRRDIGRRREEIRVDTADADAWQAVAQRAVTEDLSDADTERLHAFVKGFQRHHSGQQFAGVRVTLGTWRTLSEQPESHPLVQISGGSGTVTLRAYTFWTPQRLAQAFTDELRRADDETRRLRERVARATDENERAAVSAARPFPDENALTAALARLDQINAELHAAALRNDEELPAPADAEPITVESMTMAVALGTTADDVQADTADVDAAWTSIIGDLMQEYDELTIGVFADLMAV